MNFKFIDYSNAAFGSAVPHCHGGIFVLIRDDETAYLVLSPRNLSKHHAPILERFCELNDLEGKYVSKPSLFVFRESGWEILGGGEWTIDDQGKVLHLFGKSVAYGRFLSEGLIDKIQKIQELKKYKINIDSR